MGLKDRGNVINGKKIFTVEGKTGPSSVWQAMRLFLKSYRGADSESYFAERGMHSIYTVYTRF